MNFKKVVALGICAAMVAGMSMSTVMAADMPEQFKDLKANEAYEFPMMVKSFQSTYWQAAVKGMEKAGEELGVTFKPQGPNSESDIADHVKMSWKDFGRHSSPHIHVFYGDHEAVFGLDGEIISGDFPKKQAAFVKAWCLLHEDDLKANWKLASNGEETFRIDPLR